MASKFHCPVCKKNKQLLRGGRLNFVQTSPTNKVCAECDDMRVLREMGKGKVTLALEWLPPPGKLLGHAWHAVSRTGNLAFLLEPEREGMSAAQLLGNPRFHAGGKLWVGRFYPPSGTAFFQVAKEKAAGRRVAGGRPAVRV